MVGRVFLGRYEAVRLLGEGGMGRVYLARQTDLRRQVVVKVMHDHIALDPQFRERFQRETLVMASFQHPYAVTLYDASLNDPQGPCIVMEYIKGVTLDALLRRNTRLNPARVGRLVWQLCEVLQAAHQQSIIHRDLKPANLMIVDPDTPYELVKVMDFGLAKLLDNGHGPGLPAVTRASHEFAIGTPGYICPEQARGEATDHRGDLYSVGIILYELLSGRRPFAATSTMDMLLAHATEEPPPFAAVGASDWVPPAVEAVVRQCLAKNPNDRPANARELAELYEAALAQAAAPAPAPAPAAPKAPAEAAPAGKPRAAASRVTDPSTLTHELQAWMPETIASYKLRGFVQDVGGQVVESKPGRIRVRLAGNRGATWFGLRRRARPIDMELLLERAGGSSGNLLNITVQMRATQGDSALDAEWRERCQQIFCELRGYLMGTQ